MNEKERMLTGHLYDPYKIKDNVFSERMEALEFLNHCPFSEFPEAMKKLRGIFGSIPEDAVIIPPFYCDKGPQIHIGKHFFANTGLVILDEAEVNIGDNVFLAPRVCIFTAGHPIDAAVRNMNLEFASGVNIGNDVWIGGNVTINPGVNIGDNVVIGSGSVVTRDIPSGVVAAGNPCRVLRSITDEDREYWNRQLEEYRNDPDIE